VETVSKLGKTSGSDDYICLKYVNFGF